MWILHEKINLIKNYIMNFNYFGNNVIFAESVKRFLEVLLEVNGGDKVLGCF